MGGVAPDPRFSTLLPAFQLEMNSSSLGPAKTCLRLYQYQIIEKWQSPQINVHLVFGSLVHEGRAIYELSRAKGASHETAMDKMIDWALRATWLREAKRPWQSPDPAKNRTGLLRTLIWYMDQFGENDEVATSVLADGTLAVEIGFKFDSGYETAEGERVKFYGTLDRIGTLNDIPYILDTKTSAHQADFAKYTPDNQFSLYIAAGQAAFQIPARGLMVDHIQIGATFSRVQRGLVSRSEDQIDEWLLDAHHQLDILEKAARAGYWPMNDKACFAYGRPCEFISICAAAPSGRQKWLEKNFTRRAPSAVRRQDI